MLSLMVFDNLVLQTSAHDVTATYCLAMAEMRVQFPLGALVQKVTHQDVGKWTTPRASGARDRWFESSHPDF